MLTLIAGDSADPDVHWACSKVIGAIDEMTTSLKKEMTDEVRQATFWPLRSDPAEFEGDHEDVGS